MSIHGVTQLINTSIRSTRTIFTIFDLILISNPVKISHCGILDLVLRDHHIIYCTRKCKKIPISHHNKLTLRSLNNSLRTYLETKTA